MSGDNCYLGDGVTMNNGTKNIGMVKNAAPAAMDPELNGILRLLGAQ
ncbi:hypothetical protein HEP86_34315 [Streptomyces sp. RPA4-5]|nr:MULTISPECIES: hypothetical protein [Streptomyces]MCX4635490.1 hypothetical protein [Streptomyces platensis]QIY58640.1 hypothetical protein HEP86_34315 [Streptomyces sp. RPA4-5]WJY41883.1 hypothetical protein QT196_34095 [Streptomyces sp. P9-2B-2]